MYLISSDIETISQYIIDECKRHSLDLTESARKMLIAKGISTFRASGLRVMRETLAWEITLLPAFVSSKSRAVTLTVGATIRNRADVSAALATVGLSLYRDQEGFFTRVPKSYDVGGLKKRISAIMKR